MKIAFGSLIYIFAIARGTVGFDMKHHDVLPLLLLNQSQQQRSLQQQQRIRNINIQLQRRKITCCKAVLRRITSTCFDYIGDDNIACFQKERRIHKMRLSAGNNNEQQPEWTASSMPDKPPTNEFSRTVQTDRILKTRSNNNNYNYNNNIFYPMTIEATELECAALAHRFDLRSITTLSATLQLRPSSLNTGTTSTGSSSINIEGLCNAIVIQRCVRTNEDFEVALEFPIDCIARPVTPSNSNGGIGPELQQEDLPSTTGSYQNEYSNNVSQQKQRKQNGSMKKKKSYRLPDRIMDEMDVLELQRMLQEDVNESEDTIMEDEAIYNLLQQQIDVGELVAQLFWFKLDPYPKKPGTDPIQRSITG